MKNGNAPKLEVAESAVTELRAALARAGVILPSLGIDPLSYADPTDRPALIELGRCTAETARLLAAALPGEG
ncbi:hypothetical protein NLX86_05630 [Streptomyces sp. A3M-1-3]|uniref:hypothetical protein n=1 Tax=Streptomyces sp. A3M-1-3 TaxID=2962044 RepID=UPI0020B6C1DF|nr:hypothetical protein [Streptomyces sp. A3M-1-3]MCP3817633.1 hypothetical protein [Streptomyces sp. A3M-1-3]